MPRSLANGDYSLFMTIESSSRADSWYRVCIDRVSGQYSCDCPSWTFLKNGSTTRSCAHTDFAQQLVRQARTRTVVPFVGIASAEVLASNQYPLLTAVQEQWPGVRGEWNLENRDVSINNKAYDLYLLQMHTGNGDNASGLVAFSKKHRRTTERLQVGLAGWAGYAVAAEIARINHYPMAGQPPEHFRVSRVAATGTRRQTGSSAPRIGLNDILRFGDHADLGDGLTPAQRAENTLRMFLGEALYQQLETQHFLDFSSVCFANQKRVYRLRRDPAKARERRVRVFENGRYVHDFCIVRAQSCPEGDWYLTTALQLMSSEMEAISVVKSHNVFPPHSDDWAHRDEEIIPVVWRERVA